ncbi:MAG: 50S ribosomal protein L4 [Candidatus Aenigmarchaeota archaeon]|nr:50S ribosomal protein L4 [Candidatus Aenigmarchaeota archaeon]
MKVDVFDLSGKSVEKIELPKVFSNEVREDLIRRAVLASLSKRRQPYGTDPEAGQRSAAGYHGYRRHRYTMMNKELARMPRIHGKSVPFLLWRPRIVPQAVKGRQAHPPKVEKIWDLKINDKERKKAIRSAIAATAVKEIVAKRGHHFSGELPIVVEDKIQGLKKSKDVVNFLVKVGLVKELERIKQRKIRPGKGGMRGRKYKKKTGPLIVVAEDKGISKAVKNLSGIHTCRVDNLSASYLAPGTHPGRLTIFTKSAIEKLRKGE